MYGAAAPLSGGAGLFSGVLMEQILQVSTHPVKITIRADPTVHTELNYIRTRLDPLMTLKISFNEQHAQRGHMEIIYRI